MITTLPPKGTKGNPMTPKEYLSYRKSTILTSLVAVDVNPQVLSLLEPLVMPKETISLSILGEVKNFAGWWILTKSHIEGGKGMGDKRDEQAWVFFFETPYADVMHLDCAPQVESWRTTTIMGSLINGKEVMAPFNQRQEIWSISCKTKFYDDLEDLKDEDY